MILVFNFEELQALSAGAELLMESSRGSGGGVAAPVEALAPVSRLRPRLGGSIDIDTLDEQRWVRRAVAAICDGLHRRMDEMVVEFHPAHEAAVGYYFDYAHAYGVLTRLDEMGNEMTAMIELMTGAPVDEDSARSITFAE